MTDSGIPPLLHCRAAPSGKGAGDAPLSIGVHTGIFRRHGVDVELTPVRGGTGRIAAALGAGEVDFAVMPGIPLVEARLKGVELALLLSLVSVNLHAVIAARDISSPEQLRGKTLGGQGGAGLDDLLLRSALEGWGLEPGRDVTIANVGDRPALWAALERGEIGAFAVTAPLTIQAEIMGYPLLHRFWEPPHPFQLGAICTRRRLLDEQPDLARKFMRGMVDSIRLFQENRELGIEHIRRMTEVTHPEVLTRTYDLFSDQMRRCYPEPAALQGVLDAVARVDGRARALAPAQLIDTTILDDLRREGMALPA